MWYMEVCHRVGRQVRQAYGDAFDGDVACRDGPRRVSLLFVEYEWPGAPCILPT